MVIGAQDRVRAPERRPLTAGALVDLADDTDRSPAAGVGAAWALAAAVAAGGIALARQLPGPPSVAGG